MTVDPSRASRLVSEYSQAYSVRCSSVASSYTEESASYTTCSFGHAAPTHQSAESRYSARGEIVDRIIATVDLLAVSESLVSVPKPSYMIRALFRLVIDDLEVSTTEP
jgi:hypothetical protein